MSCNDLALCTQRPSHARSDTINLPELQSLEAIRVQLEGSESSKLPTCLCDSRAFSTPSPARPRLLVSDKKPLETLDPAASLDDSLPCGVCLSVGSGLITLKQMAVYVLQAGVHARIIPV